MNKITAAIKAKALGKYPEVYKHCDGSDHHGMFGLPDVRFYERAAYTCGGEDAIGFMLKFVEWTKNQENLFVFQDGYWIPYPYNADINSYTTEQLLLKYMEDNKL